MSGRVAGAILARMSRQTAQMAALPGEGSGLSLPPGTGRVLLNPEGENFDVALAAGALLHMLEPSGLRISTPGNEPVDEGSALFIPVERNFDFSSNADYLDVLGESADAFTLPNGIYRVTSGTLGTFPSTVHKAGVLIRTGDDIQKFDVLHTHTGRIYQRSAQLVSSVLTWGSWFRVGGQLELFNYQSFNDDTVNVIDFGESVSRYIVGLCDNTGKGGIFTCRSASTNLQCNSLVTNRTYGLYTSALTGTTGTPGADGQFNIGVQDKKLYLENRTSSQLSVTGFVYRP